MQNNILSSLRIGDIVVFEKGENATVTHVPIPNETGYGFKLCGAHGTVLLYKEGEVPAISKVFKKENFVQKAKRYTVLIFKTLFFTIPSISTISVSLILFLILLWQAQKIADSMGETASNAVLQIRSQGSDLICDGFNLQWEMCTPHAKAVRVIWERMSKMKPLPTTETLSEAYMEMYDVRNLLSRLSIIQFTPSVIKIQDLINSLKKKKSSLVQQYQKKNLFKT